MQIINDSQNKVDIPAHALFLWSSILDIIKQHRISLKTFVKYSSWPSHYGTGLRERDLVENYCCSCVSFGNSNVNNVSKRRVKGTVWTLISVESNGNRPPTAYQANSSYRNQNYRFSQLKWEEKGFWHFMAPAKGEAFVKASIRKYTFTMQKVHAILSPISSIDYIKTDADRRHGAI